MKKVLVLGLISLIPLTGCTGLNSLGSIAQQLKDDPAIVQFDIVTIYGTAKFKRIGSNTNSVTVDPDGTMRINPRVEAK